MRGARGSRREKLLEEGPEGVALYRLKLRLEEAANEFYQTDRLNKQQWIELAAAVGVHVETVKGYVLHESGVKPIHMANFAKAVGKPLAWFYDNLVEAESADGEAEQRLGPAVQQLLAGEHPSDAVQAQVPNYLLDDEQREQLDQDEERIRQAFRLLFPDWEDLTRRQVDQRLAAIRALWGRMISEG